MNLHSIAQEEFTSMREERFLCVGCPDFDLGIIMWSWLVNSRKRQDHDVSGYMQQTQCSWSASLTIQLKPSVLWFMGFLVLRSVPGEPLSGYSLHGPETD